ncbi:MAG: FHA domain-containing protein [Pseudomonadota bacterium]
MKLQVKDRANIYIVLSAKTYTLGRDPANDLVLEAAGVSDFHAEVVRAADTVMIVDLLSAAGTYVNGEKISGQHQLQAWDVVRLGDVELELNDPSVSRRSRWHLDIRLPDGTHQRHDLHGPTVLGRDADCDIVLDHELISRRHLQVRVASNHVEIQDLNSANGTVLNGRPVSEGIAYAADEIFLDPFRVVLRGGEHTQADDASHLERTQIKAEQDGDTSMFDDSPHTEIVGESFQVAYLVDISDMSRDQRYALVDSEYTLGRHADSDIVLADSSISKSHAMLKVQTGHWYIEDLDSSNGVLVNGTMVRRAPLTQGDRIKLGRAELIFGFETRRRS